MKKTHTLSWIYKKSKSLLIPVLILTAISAALSFCLVGFTLISKQLVDAATGVRPDNLAMKIVLLFLLILLQLLLQVIFSRLNIKISGKMEISLKSSIFSSLLNKELKDFYKYHTGELLTRLTSDINVITNGFINIVPTFVSFLTRLIVALTVMFLLDPYFALIYVVAGPVFILLARIYSKKMKSLHKLCQESEGKVRSYMQESMQNILVIKAFNKEEPIINETVNLQRNNYVLKIKRNTISILAHILMYIAFTFGYYFALGWGAFKLSYGLITFGTFTAMLQLVGQIQTPFKGLSDILPQYYSTIASAERLIELEELKDDLDFESSVDIEKIRGKIEKINFKNVCFSYDDQSLVIDNFSFEIKFGEFVAISGISGIGKSTLLKLLLGVIEKKSGEITLTLNDGGTINIDKNTRRLFSYVPQGNMILSGTIKDNIRFFNDEVTDAEIENAAKIAQIYDFISDLPSGFDTVIGEKGLGLSEGQIQRIAIARALICDSPFLLLDEATSALDEATEKSFLSAIKELKTVTCIIVSHKKAAIDICDKIINIL